LELHIPYALLADRISWWALRPPARLVGRFFPKPRDQTAIELLGHWFYTKKFDVEKKESVGDEVLISLYAIAVEDLQEQAAMNEVVDAICALYKDDPSRWPDIETLQRLSVDSSNANVRSETKMPYRLFLDVLTDRFIFDSSTRAEGKGVDLMRLDGKILLEFGEASMGVFDLQPTTGVKMNSGLCRYHVHTCTQPCDLKPKRKIRFDEPWLNEK